MSRREAHLQLLATRREYFLARARYLLAAREVERVIYRQALPALLRKQAE